VPGGVTVVAIDKPQSGEVAGTVTVAETTTGFFPSRGLTPVIVAAIVLSSVAGTRVPPL